MPEKPCFPFDQPLTVDELQHFVKLQQSRIEALENITQSLITNAIHSYLDNNEELLVDTIDEYIKNHCSIEVSLS